MTPTDPVRRAGGTSKLPRARREELLLDVATEEFGAVGYAGASLGRIAERAGVSKALVLTYFGSKDGLYAACAGRAGTNLISRIEPVLAAPARPPRDLAQATLAAMFSGLEGRLHDWNVLNDRTVPPGAGAEVVRRMHRTIAAQASRGVAGLRDLTALQDPDDLAVLTEVWMSAVTAVVNWWLRHPDRSAAEMTARCERVLTAITAQGPRVS
ncbi:TetR/AcrR family transcriptional regulator [Streptomyces sp. NPDC046821]|uniref:TetR/AcrR family transcriptional regulator n=1 Tax=Streptomyces sp. NPDC046821 TaxID=3154702 RepID=UPI0033C32300